VNSYEKHVTFLCYQMNASHLKEIDRMLEYDYDDFTYTIIAS